ncbi:uncharacterized protein LOC103840530 [Brassica rapa]|uniref:uncharacterized protein LOC103840530 n=1 Tax=Brassica campestris TaxID=3711 RepID=UPI0004F14173|nr:uncharacterized protein LOC103840530 [Brassica rapa]
MNDLKSTSKTREVVPSTMVCTMLSSTNYTVWAMRMKVLLRVHKFWESIEPETDDEEKKNIDTALMFQWIPENQILQVGEVDSPKKIWEAVKSRNLGVECVKETRLQTLMNAFKRLRMKDTDSIDIFTGKISELASKSTALGQTLKEPKLVKKFLNNLPQRKYIQIIASLEKVLDLNKKSFEDIVERLKAYEEQIQGENRQEPQGNLLYTDSNQSYNSRGRGRSWNRGRGNRGKGRGRTNTQARGKGKKNQDDHDLNKADIEEADIALYMHEIVFLNEDKVIPKTLEQSKREDGMWYLDNGASNHMTGERSYFSELNESIKGKVKFGDGSCVDINDKGSMLFEAKTGEHRFLTDIYYIPDLKSNILSLVQATEQG